MGGGGVVAGAKREERMRGGGRNERNAAGASGQGGGNRGGFVDMSSILAGMGLQASTLNMCGCCVHPQGAGGKSPGCCSKVCKYTYVHLYMNVYVYVCVCVYICVYTYTQVCVAAVCILRVFVARRSGIAQSCIKMCIYTIYMYMECT